MCGLVGMAGAITMKDEKVFRTLLILDSLRGIDSTGVAVVPRFGEVRLVKEVGNPFNLFDHKAYDKAFVGFNRCVIGHNRYATQGVINRKNAHPYEFDTLVGAHNGTLRNKWKLDDNQQFDVDSENLYHHIDKKGLRDAINIIDGAWALTWWDKVNETVNFLRNSERPLHLVSNKANTVIYWASEAWMLSVALSREGIEREEIISLTEDMHHSIHISNTGVIDKPVVTPMAGRVHTQDPWKAYSNPKTTATAAPVPPVANATNGGNTTQAQTKPTLTLSKHLPEGDSKKSRVVPITAKQQPSGLKVGYENSRNASLEVIGYGSDRYGACYYSCKDEEAPGVAVRLYFNPGKKVRDEVGTRFTADIGACVVSPVEGTYYKVVASSVKGVKNSVKVTQEEQEEKETYRNSRGHQVDYNTWMSQHGTCSNCTCNVLPTEKYVFTPNGDVICEFCTDDPVVQMLYNIRK